jgi:hypothetical protein
LAGSSPVSSSSCQAISEPSVSATAGRSGCACRLRDQPLQLAHLAGEAEEPYRPVRPAALLTVALVVLVGHEHLGASVEARAGGAVAVGKEHASDVDEHTAEVALRARVGRDLRAVGRDHGVGQDVARGRAEDAAGRAAVERVRGEPTGAGRFGRVGEPRLVVRSGGGEGRDDRLAAAAAPLAGAAGGLAGRGDEGGEVEHLPDIVRCAGAETAGRDCA